MLVDSDRGVLLSATLSPQLGILNIYFLSFRGFNSPFSSVIMETKYFLMISEYFKRMFTASAFRRYLDAVEEWPNSKKSAFRR